MNARTQKSEVRTCRIGHDGIRSTSKGHRVGAVIHVERIIRERRDVNRSCDWDRVGGTGDKERSEQNFDSSSCFHWGGLVGVLERLRGGRSFWNRFKQAPCQDKIQVVINLIIRWLRIKSLFHGTWISDLAGKIVKILDSV